MRFAPLPIASVLLLGGAGAVAEPAASRPAGVLLAPAPEEREVGALWPLVLSMHGFMGAEPHKGGSPVVFGAGAELLWRGIVGGFAALSAAEGAPIERPAVDGQVPPGYPDRISAPFGAALRPLAPIFIERSGYLARLLSGLGLQVGATIEHLRAGHEPGVGLVESATTAGFHLAGAWEVPLYGGPRQGGLALRLAGRLIVAPSVALNAGKQLEPGTAGQLLAGLSYIP